MAFLVGSFGDAHKQLGECGFCGRLLVLIGESSVANGATNARALRIACPDSPKSRTVGVHRWDRSASLMHGPMAAHSGRSQIGLVTAQGALQKLRSQRS